MDRIIDNAVIFSYSEIKKSMEEIRKSPAFFNTEFDRMQEIQPNYLFLLMQMVEDDHLDLYSKELISRLFMAFWTTISQKERVKRFQIYMEVFDKNYENNRAYLLLFHNLENDEKELALFMEQSFEGNKQKESFMLLSEIVSELLKNSGLNGSEIAKIFCTVKSCVDSYEQLLNDRLKAGIDYIENV